MKPVKDKHEEEEQFDYFNSMTVCSLAKLNLFGAAFVHAMISCLFFYSDQTILGVVNICSMILYIAFGIVVNISSMRNIFCIVICEIVAFIFMSVNAIGWSYSVHIYSFSIIALAILTSISKKKDRYVIEYPLIIFLLSHGFLLAFRIYTWFNPIEPKIKFTKQIEMLFNIQGVTNYVFVALATFIPLLAFIVDLNKANENMEMISAELEYISSHDLLTSLLNRHSMGDKFEEIMEDYKTNGKEFSFILGDIDDFKKINDTYGHNAGDYVLAEVSRTIMDASDDGYVCRWGGEEILIVVRGGLQKALEQAENIRKNIEDKEFFYEGSPISVTLTQGVAEFKDDISIEGLIGIVDDNLYKGKQSTKNCVIA